MNEVTLIGIDLGKHVFHLHAQDAKGPPGRCGSQLLTGAVVGTRLST